MITVLSVLQKNDKNNLQEFISDIDEYMLEFFSARIDLINEAVQDFIQAGGKRFRPLLTFLATRFGSYDHQQVVKVAAGLELLHMAILVHDDILDFSGSPEILGKKIGEDLSSGIYTFPVILLLQQDDSGQELRDILSRDIYSRADVSRVLQLIREGETLQRSERLARRFIDRSWYHLNQLEDSFPAADSPRIIRSLLAFQLKRKK